MFHLTNRMPMGRFFKDLYNKIQEDNVFNGAAALAFFLLLALFPALIFLLSLIPYLPVENLHRAVMDAFGQALPGDTVKLIESVLGDISRNSNTGLLSVGLLLTVWSASAGLYAVMQQLNITYGVKEGRPFWKARGTAIVLTVLFTFLIIGAFALIVFGGVFQAWLGSVIGFSQPMLVVFSIFRWVVIAALLLLGFSITYYFGPDVEQKFKFITPGSVTGVLVFAIGSMVFRIYAENFSNYSATYGSLGAVILLMFWLYLTGLVILLGSEVNSLIERYSSEGKSEGEKKVPLRGKQGADRPKKSASEGLSPARSWSGSVLFAGLALALAFALPKREENG